LYDGPFIAAGAIESTMTTMGMNESVILPTINCEFSCHKCDLDYVPNEVREIHLFIALSNSLVFGGRNASLCLGKFRK
jgi:3-oxoacyl-[acyl-carrier-protein] synthase II